MCWRHRSSAAPLGAEHLSPPWVLPDAQRAQPARAARPGCALGHRSVPTARPEAEGWPRAASWGGSTAPGLAPRAGTEPSCVSVVLLGPVHGVKPGEIKSIAWKRFPRLPSCPAGEPGHAQGWPRDASGAITSLRPNYPTKPLRASPHTPASGRAAPSCAALPAGRGSASSPISQPHWWCRAHHRVVGLQPRACQ